ncbi:MAG: hypothetical protein NVS3B20_11930 [Polyangiales bacterium]
MTDDGVAKIEGYIKGVSSGRHCKGYDTHVDPKGRRCRIELENYERVPLGPYFNTVGLMKAKLAAPKGQTPGSHACDIALFKAPYVPG